MTTTCSNAARLSAVVWVVACAHAAGPRAVCRHAGALTTPRDWRTFLVSADRRRDCSGRPLVDRSDMDGADTDGPGMDGADTDRANTDLVNIDRPDMQPSVAQGAADDLLLLSPTDPAGRRVVWAMTHTFDDGSASGPIALAEASERGVFVTALGRLRMGKTRPRLRLHRVGGVSVVVAEGARCAKRSPKSASPCSRRAQLLVRAGTRLATPSLRYPDGHPAGRAEAWLSHEQEVAMGRTLTRRFRLNASFDIRSDRIVLHEEVAVDDLVPGADGVSLRPFRKARDRRTFRPGGRPSAKPQSAGRPAERVWKVEAQPLLERVLRTDGSASARQRE